MTQRIFILHATKVRAVRTNDSDVSSSVPSVLAHDRRTADRTAFGGPRYSYDQRSLAIGIPCLEITD